MKTAERLDECQTCGHFGKPGQEFHSYESCLMKKWREERLTEKERKYIFSAGLKAMATRIRNEELPGA